jgi:Tol biopolymer transport system component
LTRSVAFSDRVGGLDVADVKANATPRLVAARPQGFIAWSPDLAQVAFELPGDCDVTKPCDLRLVTQDVRTGVRRQIHALATTTEPCVNWADNPKEFAWAPDGRRLAYVVEYDYGGDPGQICEIPDTPVTDLYVIGSDGRGRRLVARADIDTLAWSRDGSRLAYVDCNHCDTLKLYVVDADGSHKRLISNAFPDSISIAWSARGEELLRLGARGLYALTIATRRWRTIVNWRPRAGYHSMAVSPDGRTIVLARLAGPGMAFGYARAIVWMVPLHGPLPRPLSLPAPSGQRINDLDIVAR